MTHLDVTNASKTLNICSFQEFVFKNILPEIYWQSFTNNCLLNWFLKILFVKENSSCYNAVIFQVSEKKKLILENFFYSFITF